ncbi:MAG TPA: Flp pilus assembly protein CpaB [Candidatus Acidoferrum sp.]|nr:Flp pilus assembly protein CpaB [Candidatus Acidoferrum sp.]
MNVKSVILIVAALLFAGGTAFVASKMMGHKPAPQQAQVQEAPAKKVLVAKGNLPAGTFIKEEDVSWQKWPVDGVNDAYLLEGQADISTIVGAVVRKGIVAGSPITEAQIARPGDRGFLAAVLTPGMRAISIDVNEPSSVAGLVFPGDRVDVLLNMQFTLEPVGGQQSSYRPQTSETVLENVRLLATDRNLNDIEGEPKKLNTVTIEVTPKQAEMIKVAAQMGQLALSLRGLGMPDGKGSGPTVASAQTAASTFFAQQADTTGPESAQPKDKSNSNVAGDDPAPERGETYTFDAEVSRPMQELMHGKGIQIVRGNAQPAAPAIETVTAQ